MNTAVRFGRLTQSGRALVTLTLRGTIMLTVAIVALAVAYLADLPELLMVACFCGIPPVMALILVATLRPRLTVTRFVTPTTLTAGMSGSSILQVRNVARARTLPARWSDLQPWEPRTTPAQELPEVASGHTGTLRYTFVPPVRGIRELGPLLTEVMDPFRLARAQFAVGERGRIVVAPRSVSLPPGSLVVASDSGSARLFNHRALAGEHDVMTRDYRRGDALRRVHWKASAHHGELMVREDEKQSHSEAVILLDTRRHSYRDTARVLTPDRPESEHFEWALSMAASLRDHWVRAGLKVRVVETAVPQLAGAAHPDDFVESLARIRLSYQEPSVLRLTGDQQTPHGTILAILDDPDGETVSALIDQRSSFTTAVALLLDPPKPILAEQLVHAGWNVYAVANGDTVAAVWQRLGTGMPVEQREQTELRESSELSEPAERSVHVERGQSPSQRRRPPDE